MKALMAAITAAEGYAARPPSEASTSHVARPELADTAPSDVTLPIINSVSQEVLRSASFHELNSPMPGRNITTPPRTATTTTSIWRIHELAIQSASITDITTMTFSFAGRDRPERTQLRAEVDALDPRPLGWEAPEDDLRGKRDEEHDHREADGHPGHERYAHLAVLLDEFSPRTFTELPAGVPMPPISEAMGMPIITPRANCDWPGARPIFSNRPSATAMKIAVHGDVRDNRRDRGRAEHQ